MKLVRRVLVASSEEELQALVNAHLADAWVEVPPRLVSGRSPRAEVHRQLVEKMMEETPSIIFGGDQPVSKQSLPR